MRWEDERYIRVFTRDTPSWDAMGWEAQALLMLVFRKMDRTGVLALGNSGRRGLAACVRMPLDVVDRALDILLADGVLTMSGQDIFCPNFMAAQECAKSDALRSREKRERAHHKLTQSVSTAPQTVARTPRSDTSAPRSDTPSVPSVLCLPDLTRKKRAAPAVGSEAFEAFWVAFPEHRRVNKPEAIKAWPGDEHAAAIMSHLEAVIRKDNGEFIQQADRYLRKETWKVPVFDKSRQHEQQPTLRWATPEVD